MPWSQRWFKFQRSYKYGFLEKLSLMKLAREIWINFKRLLVGSYDLASETVFWGPCIPYRNVWFHGCLCLQSGLLLTQWETAGQVFGSLLPCVRLRGFVGSFVLCCLALIAVGIWEWNSRWKTPLSFFLSFFRFLRAAQSPPFHWFNPPSHTSQQPGWVWSWHLFGTAFLYQFSLAFRRLWCSMSYYLLTFCLIVTALSADSVDV